MELVKKATTYTEKVEHFKSFSKLNRDHELQTIWKIISGKSINTGSRYNKPSKSSKSKRPSTSKMKRTTSHEEKKSVSRQDSKNDSRKENKENKSKLTSASGAKQGQPNLVNYK